MYGDAQAEKAGDDDLFNGEQASIHLFSHTKKKKTFFFGGVNYNDIKKIGISNLDINPYIPLDKKAWKNLTFNTFSFTVLS